MIKYDLSKLKNLTNQSEHNKIGTLNINGINTLQIDIVDINS